MLGHISFCKITKVRVIGTYDYPVSLYSYVDTIHMNIGYVLQELCLYNNYISMYEQLSTLLHVFERSCLLYFFKPIKNAKYLNNFKHIVANNGAQNTT